MRLRPPRLARTAAYVPFLALGFTACGAAVSTSSFGGEQRAVAQVIANLQSDATASDQGKICSRDLAAALVKTLNAHGGCEAAIKRQLAEIDNLEASVKSVTLASAGNKATATVKSVYAGKQHLSTLALVKEAAGWRIAGLG